MGGFIAARPLVCRQLVAGAGRTDPRADGQSRGAAAAVIFVLNKLGIIFNVVSRKLHEGSTLTYNQIDKQVVEESTLIINTTPLGMYPDTDTCPAIPYQHITERHLLYDLVYNPARTLFLSKGEGRGATIKNGEEMLILQAEESWRIWNS